VAESKAFCGDPEIEVPHSGSALRLQFRAHTLNLFENLCDKRRGGRFFVLRCHNHAGFGVAV